MTIRVLLIDDHPLVVDGLRSAFADAPDIDVTAVASSLAEARTALEEPVDVVVCDIRLPDGSGFELLRESHAASGPPAFLMLSSFDAPQYIDAAARMGAAGFVLKTAPSAEIAAAIRDIHGGGSHFATVAQPPSEARLSARERTLVEAVVRGRSNDQIAADLRVSRKTIEAQLTRLYERTGVNTRTELAVAAERGRWLDIPN